MLLVLILTILSGMLIVFRDCNPRVVGEVCRDQIIEDHPIHVCYQTCDYDGCNGGSAITSDAAYRPIDTLSYVPIILSVRHLLEICRTVL